MTQQTATRELAQPRAPSGFLTFLTVWFGQVISVLGTGLTAFALGVWVYQRTGSVTLFALMSTAAILPGLIASPFAGAFVDRWDRRWVMIVSNVLSSLNILAVALLLYAGRLEIWHIYIALMLNSIAGAFHQPAFSASTTLLVSKEHYGRASGMVQLGVAIAQIAAPLLAGLLMATIEIWGAVLVDGATFLFAMLSLLVVRIPRPPVTSEGAAARGKLRQEATFGLRYIAARPGLLGLLLFLALTNFTVGIVQVLLTPLVLSFAAPAVLGQVLSVGGIGMLLGGIIVSIWGGPRRRVLGILGFALLQGVMLMLGGLQPSALLIGGATAVFLFSTMFINSCNQAIWQSKVPPDLQGRVFSIRMMVAWSSLPLAYLSAGPLADYVFEPLMAAGGPLAGSVGQLIGVGPGRGIGLLAGILGILVILSVIAGYVYPRLRFLERELPDVTPAPAPTPRDSELLKEELTVQTNQSLASLGATPAEQTPAQPASAVLFKTNGVISLLTLIFLAIFIAIGIYRLAPPAAVPASAPPTEFSAERAVKHIETFAPTPHPIGSPELIQAREYLVRELTALGLEFEPTPADPGYLDLVGPQAVALLTGDINNIVARLKGSNGSGKAILLLAHYDSVPSGPGATDGGAGVATILETLRALKASGPIKNDVIVLLTDAEEHDLLGVRGFVSNHPWVNEVGFAMHFVARGTNGPAILFETTPQNGRVIAEFAKVAPRPIGNSLAYTVYQYLPNGTDFSFISFKGIPGLNFAHIDGHVRYHTMLDNPENVDRGSLQHHGSYALALTRYFGNLDLENLQQDDAIFFDLWGLTLINYPQSWTLPLAVFVALVFIGVMALGFRRGHLSFGGVALGVLALLLAGGGAYGVTTLVWRAVLLARSDYRWLPHGEVYNPSLYLAGFAALTIALAAGIYALFRKKVSAPNLAAGGLTVWLTLMIATALYLPGGSYIFTWPLLFSLLALGLLFATRGEQPSAPKRFAILSLGAIPGLVLLVPTIYLIYMAITITTVAAVMVMVTLLIGLLIPHLALLERPRPVLLPAAAAVLGLGMIVVAALPTPYDVNQRKANSLFYVLNRDANKAFWASQDAEPDEWTSRFIPLGSTRGPLGDDFPFWPKELYPTFQFLKSPATVVALPDPNAEILSDTVADGIRTLRMRLTSPRGAQTLLLRLHTVPETVKHLRAGFNGKMFDYSERMAKRKPTNPANMLGSFIYFDPPKAGVEFTIEITNQPIKLLMFDLSNGLGDVPEAVANPRPNYMMPNPDEDKFQDTVMISKTVAIPEVGQ